ncbi:MAG: FG-GAP repeat protein [Ignavibacteriales bacterium]|nr:MAG: FG-GAP repeat protein [Ignavibacteriales bacterium]
MILNKKIFLFVLLFGLIATGNAQELIKSPEQKIDINTKSQEPGISSEQLQSILNSASNKGGGEPLPEAIQERIFTGQVAGDQFAFSVSSAGDVNGDGYDDIIVGAPFAQTNGRAYVFFGGQIINSIPDRILDGGNLADSRFGWSVSSAGDVNGDGFDDVIVGACSSDAAGSAAGSAFIYLGGNPMSQDFYLQINGSTAGDRLGISVSTAGDVNGDGYSDVIVGADRNDTGGANSGSAYIFYGGQVMNNIADVILTGEAVSDVFGYSVSEAGDVNGDGYSDVIVGAIGNDAGGTSAGRAYIYLGGSPMDIFADVILTGETAGDSFGSSVSSAGDANGDGYSDAVVGADLNDVAGNTAGRAYIYFGGSSMDNITDVVLTGAASSDVFGSSVSSAGDINGDGYSDVIVGAQQNDTGGDNAGRAYVYFGGESMDNIADVILTGEEGERFGGSVSIAGDMNGDGYTDVIVGAHFNDAGGVNAGRAYLYTNSLTGSDIPDEFFTGSNDQDFLGCSVSTAGDVNGDGYDDVIVGAWGTGTSEQGSAYIFLGGSGMDNIADIVLTGESAGDNFGYSVSALEDVNGDGYSDVIVGARQNDAGGNEAGRAYIYFGGVSMDNIADVILTGVASGDFFGESVSNAGDVNGDGYFDVIVGAQKNDAAGSDAGRAYIYFGGVSMDNIADVTLTGEAAGDQFGSSVSTSGDVNGDGYFDVIIGAVGYPFGGSDGRAYIYYGGQLMNNVADVIMTGGTAADFLGSSVSTAKDLNRDGYDDIIIGARGNDMGGTNSGQVYIYFGAQTMDNIPDVTLNSEAAGDFFGVSVHSAGDFNQDSYSDVIVGADRNDAAGISTGRVYVYFGAPNMDDVADLILTGETANNFFGGSVSNAGDVNGDGLIDIIIGAIGYDGQGFDWGRAYLHLSSTPPIKPPLKSVKDIPNDQGGYVRVSWKRSGYDILGQNRIAEYILQRSDPPGTPGFIWDYVATIPAIRELEYSYVSPTPYDSMSNTSGTFYFRVIARGTHPDELWYSNIKYGHSVDNLSPSVPLNFYANILGDDVKLGWKANTESDLYNYVIYRSDVAGANPDTLDIYTQTFDTTFVDTNPLSGTAYYFLRAQDVHNNLSLHTTSSISAQATFSLSVSVYNGWNMVSVPGLHPVDQNVNTWWQFRNPLADVYRWTTTYVPVTTTAPTQGYWMLHNGSVTYNTGEEWPAIQSVPNNPITVNTGWNMIGGYENFVPVNALTTTPPGLIVPNTIYGWDGTYFNAVNLEPGFGYWILLSGNGVINISSDVQQQKIVASDYTEKFGSIIFSDASGKKFILYTIEGQANPDHYLMPPLPPKGSFDIRYSTGRKAEDIKAGYQVIEFRSLEYPFTITAEGVDLNLQDETGKIVNSNLRSGEKLTIHNDQITKLLVKENFIPVEFSLKQNYPNPFNPTTTISYSIPYVETRHASSQHVTLTVYDVLGNEVITLVNENKPGGQYEVEFNAEGLSSGVYFYRLNAGSFSETKKLVLMK